MRKWVVFILVGIVASEIGGIAVENQQELQDFGITSFDVQQTGCPKIKDLKPLAHPKSLIGNWRVAFMSTSWIHGVANSMHRTTLKNSGLESVCIKVAVLPMPIWKADLNSIIWVATKCPKTGRTVDLGCGPTGTVDSEWTCRDMNVVVNKGGNSKAGESYVYIFQDGIVGLDYALVLECKPKSWIRWAILTKEKVIDPKLIKHLTGKLKGMGFNVDNLIELSTEKC